MAKIPSGYVFLMKPRRKGLQIEVEQKELIMCKNCKWWSQQFPFDLCERNEVPFEAEEDDWCSRAEAIE